MKIKRLVVFWAIWSITLIGIGPQLSSPLYWFFWSLMLCIYVYTLLVFEKYMFDDINIKVTKQQ